MPLQRGGIYAFTGESSLRTEAFLVLTNDRWNAAMSQVGVVPIRRSVEALETPYAVPLADGRCVIACALLSLDLSTERDPGPIGRAVASAAPEELVGAGVAAWPTLAREPPEPISMPSAAA